MSRIGVRHRADNLARRQTPTQAVVGRGCHEPEPRPVDECLVRFGVPLVEPRVDLPHERGGPPVEAVLLGQHLDEVILRDAQPLRHHPVPVDGGGRVRPAEVAVAAAGEAARERPVCGGERPQGGVRVRIVPGGRVGVRLDPQDGVVQLVDDAPVRLDHRLAARHGRLHVEARCRSIVDEQPIAPVEALELVDPPPGLVRVGHARRCLGKRRCRSGVPGVAVPQRPEHVVQRLGEGDAQGGDPLADGLVRLALEFRVVERAPERGNLPGTGRQAALEQAVLVVQGAYERALPHPHTTSLPPASPSAVRPPVPANLLAAAPSVSEKAAAAAVTESASA